MSWSDRKEHRLYHLARKWDARWGDQLGSFGLASLDDYDSDDALEMPQDIVDSQSHTFKTKVFRNPHSCSVCKEIIWNEGRACRVCKFACHKRCEYKVMTTCLPPVNYPLPSNDKLKQGTPKSPRSPRTSPEGKSGMSSPKDSRQRTASPTSPRSLVTPPATPPVTPSTPEMTSVPKLQQPPPTTQHVKMTSIKTTIKGGDGLVRYSFELDVDYITERLIAVSFPSGGLENQYRSNLRDVIRMLKSKHSNSYVVFNLSRRRHDITKLNQEVRDLGWPDVLAPPLERLCSICKQIETWLKANPNNVVVLHCKGGRGPIGVVVSAFMNYMNITSSGDTSLDRYAMKRFLDAKIVGNMHPSQCRYVDYFIGLLTNSIQINSAPLYLHHVLIHGVPNYDSNGGCRPFLRIYQGMHPVYTSGVYTVPEGTSRFAITPNRAIPLRGDILLKCYHKKFRSTTRDTVFRCQFHTTAVMEYRLVFHKNELDDACTDARFPEFTKVELIFSSTPDSLHGSDYVSGANFPSELIDDPLIRWDSYEHFNDIIEGPEDGGNDLLETSGNNNNNMILDIPHSPAPDGSLYAQVKKTPSPEQSPLLTHTQMVNGGTQPYVITPEKSPIVNGPRHGGGTSSSSTPSTPSTIRQQPSPGAKRHMDYKERMALDELLKGITGEDIHVTVNNNTHWKGPPSPENVQILRQEPVHTRRIVSVSEDLRKAPVNQKPQQIPVKEPITEEAPQVNNTSPKKTLVTRKASSDSENPYAEIPEAMQKVWQQNPNTNLSGPSEEVINPQTQTQQEHAAPPMVNGGLEIPRSSEQHNPTYEYTRNGARVGNPRTTQNGPAHVSHNPGPSHVTHNPGPHQMTHNPGPNQMAHNPGTPHVAQMNGPVETTIVPNAVSRPTEQSPYLTRLDGNPSTPSPNPHQYQPKPLVARQERILIVRKEPNEPLLPQPVTEQHTLHQPIPQQHAPQQQALHQQAPPQKSPQPSPTGWNDPDPGSVSKSSAEDDDGGLNWLRRQQEKLREKREREQGRPIVRESPLKKGPSSSSPRLQHVAEPVSVTPVNAIPVGEPEQRTTEPKVRFEMDNIQQSEPVTSSPPPVNGSMSWLEQQQQKLRDRRAQEQATSVNQSPIVASSSTPVNASPLVPLADTPSQNSGVSSRRDHTPTPLTISKDLQNSIDSLGNVGPKTTPNSYLHQTITTTTTTKTEWQPHERPLNRQMSDLTHDRVRDAVFQRPIVDQYPKTPQTPYDPVPPVLSPSRMYQGADGRNGYDDRRWQDYYYDGDNVNALPPNNHASPATNRTAFHHVHSDSPRQPRRHLDFHDNERLNHTTNTSNFQHPRETERNIRTFHKQTMHAENTNQPMSVPININPPHSSTVHGPHGRTFTRSLSNSGMNELLSSVEPTNNNTGADTLDALASLDDAVRMLSHWSNEIQKLSAPYTSSSQEDANHNPHASSAKPITSHHFNQSEARINSTHNQTLQSNGGFHYPSQTLTNHRPQATSTPRKDFDEIDLHIEEPMESVIPRGVVADRSPNYVDRSMSPPPPHPNRSRPPRRTNSQSGYDSDTGIQQYYRPPRRRNLIDPGAEVWLQNPGGLPQKETQYWNRAEGLKSPDAEEMMEKPRPVEYDWSSSTESIPGNSRTPKFPVGPKAYANMVKTCIAVVGKPPHGPDEPLPLSPLKRQDSDTFDNGPLPQAGEVYTPPPSYSTVTIETSPLYTERREVQVEELSPVPPSPGRVPMTPSPIEARVEKIPRRHLEFIESEPRVGSAGDAKPYQQPVLTNLPQGVPPSRAEPQRWNAQPQQVVTTVVPTTGPQTVTTIQWREEIVRQPVDVQPIEAQTQEEVEARKPKRRIERPLIPRYVREVNAAPPTGPLPPASEPEAPLPQVQSRVQPRIIPHVEPQVLPKPQPSRIVEPPITEVRLHGVELGPIRSVPVEAQVVVENRSQAPGYPTPTTTYQGAPSTSTAPPASSVAYQTQVPTQQASPTPISRGIVQPAPQVAVVTSPGQESPIIQQRVDVKQVTETQNVPSPQIQPKQQQQQQQQQQPLTNEQLLNRPTPGVQYPTFSDRHRKAARGPAEDAPGLTPNGGAGYRTLYDNRKQRSSLGNEGQLPSPGGISTSGTTRTAVNGNATPPTTLSGRSTPSNFYYTQKLSPYGSSSSLADPSVEHVRFVKDLSAWWYKPNISRDDAINMLKDKAPGTFVVRDSNSFPGAFGLALKVAQLPANTAPRKGGDPQSELVRHFLIEPNARGVRLKGCANEPIFGSLSALIYQHTLTQLALPIKLMLPDTDPSGSDSTDAALDSKSAAALLSQGAACKVLYIQSIDMESLTGSEAVREALTRVLNDKKKPQAVVVHFKVSSKGVTLTDLQRKVFFRKHYPVESILYSGMDPLTRKYPRKEGQEVADAKIFGVVARKPGSLTDNQCHLFADYEVEQPASAIVSFVTKVLLGMGKTTTPKTP